jgi:hypothetical protein
MLIIYAWIATIIIFEFGFGYLAKKYNWFGFTDKWPKWVRVFCYMLIFAFAGVVLLNEMGVIALNEHF